MRHNRPWPSPGGPAPAAWGPRPLPAGAWRSVTRAVVETQRSQWEQGLTSPAPARVVSTGEAHAGKSQGLRDGPGRRCPAPCPAGLPGPAVPRAGAGAGRWHLCLLTGSPWAWLDFPFQPRHGSRSESLGPQGTAAWASEGHKGTPALSHARAAGPKVCRGPPALPAQVRLAWCSRSSGVG